MPDIASSSAPLASRPVVSGPVPVVAAAATEDYVSETAKPRSIAMVNQTSSIESSYAAYRESDR